MLDAESIRFIREEIRRSMNVILPGTAGASTQHTETINELWPGMPGIPDRPIMHPYGFVSRATQGTMQVNARGGDHPANQMVLGHRDKNRSADLLEGEAEIYSIGTYKVRCFKDKIQVSKNGDWETVVVGETLRDFLKALIEAIVAHTHLGNMGFPTGVPLNNPTFTSLKANNLDNDKILAKDSGRY